MFKITIKSQIHGELWLEKQTQAEVDEYVHWCADSKHWGSPQWIEEISEVLEVKDEAGVIIIPAQPAYQIVHPAEYELIIEDMTAQIEAEKAQIEIVRQSQLAAVQRMQSFSQDIDSCQDLDSVKAALKTFVADVALLLLVK